MWWRISRGGADPFAWTKEPADGRWQEGDSIRALYLGDSADTAWAEWYRHTSELGVPPDTRLPRDSWQILVDVADIADLTAPGVLATHGVPELFPSRRQWPQTQAIGQVYWHDGRRGILAPSAAHVGGHVLALFRPSDGPISGLTASPPPTHHTTLPPLPTGLRT